MVNLLIREPHLSLDELGTRLGITKQAVAEKKQTGRSSFHKELLLLERNTEI